MIPLFKIRCSMIWAVMTNPKWWSPRAKYDKAVSELARHEEQYANMKKKDWVNWIKKRDKILELRDEIVELEKNKDTIVLSETTLSYLEDWLKENVYHRPKILDTKALEKGIECEKEAVIVLNRATWNSFKKSKYAEWEKMENERCTGHEDIDDTEKKETRDTKVCKDFSTFPLIKEIKESWYEWQWQWYMWLKGPEYKKHYIAKCLVNTPAHQIQQELFYIKLWLERKYNWNMEIIDDEYIKKARKLFMQHVYDKQVTVNADWEELQLTDDQVIPYEDRVRICEVERDDNKIELIKQRVEEIRAYLLQLWYEFYPTDTEE